MEKMILVNIEKEMSWDDILDSLWGAGKENALRLNDAGKGDAFMDLLEEWKDEEALTGGTGVWDLTRLNDWLMFGFEEITDILGLKEDVE